jgi:hypothetical protein
MSDEPRSWTATLVYWTLGVLVLLVLYVLSVGPAQWMLEHGYLPGGVDTLNSMYSPLTWIVANDEFFGGAIRAYALWWVN